MRRVILTALILCSPAVLTFALTGPLVLAQSGPPSPVSNKPLPLTEEPLEEEVIPPAAGEPMAPPPAAIQAKPAQPAKAAPPPPKPRQVETETLFNSGEIADQMTISLRGAGALTGRRIAVLPFFDLHDLQTTTELGRLISEELASALHFRNFHLAEIRTDDQLVLSRWVGESYLARTGPDRNMYSVRAKMDSLRERHNLGGLVVGTYAVLPKKNEGPYRKRLVGGRVAFNARIIDPVSGAVLAMGTAKISINRTVEALLTRRSAPLIDLPTEEIKAKRY